MSSLSVPSIYGNHPSELGSQFCSERCASRGSLSVTTRNSLFLLIGTVKSRRQLTQVNKIVRLMNSLTRIVVKRVPPCWLTYSTSMESRLVHLHVNSIADRHTDLLYYEGVYSLQYSGFHSLTLDAAEV